MHKLIYFILFLLVILRVASINHVYPEGARIRIKGRVLSEPVVYDNARFIKLKGLGAYVDLFPEVNYGDFVVLEGKVSRGRLKDAVVLEVRQGEWLYGLRQKIISMFKKALPEPHASLVSGVVLGSKAQMPTEFWESLKLTGTAHVVVASGMNVTFVISFLVNSLIKFVKRQRAIVVAVVCAWVYVVLSGFDAPLVRAAIMGTIAFGAQAAGRVSVALHALFVSAALMLIAFPDWVYDTGFILSFIATLSLILFETKVSKMLARVPFLFKKDLATTLAAQVGTAPILFLTFGNFNLLSPIINSLILWTIPPIMLIGASAALAGLAVPALGELILYLAYPFTWWFTVIIKYSTIPSLN